MEPAAAVTLSIVAVSAVFGTWAYSIYDLLNQEEDRLETVSRVRKDAWVFLMVFGFPIAQLYWFGHLRRRLKKSRAQDEA